MYPEKCLFREKDKSMVISDLHLGKINHFRKAGIGLPMAASKADFDQLELVLIKYKPRTVVFLGDLFHSTYNQSVDKLKQALLKHTAIDFILIKGNHDIMDNTIYEDLNIHCLDYLVDGSFIFSHDKLEYDTDHFNIYGHIHPGVLLTGKARQSSRFPCFYFTKSEAILPAFGKFTGLHMMKVKEGDEVYIVHNDKVIKV